MAKSISRRLADSASPTGAIDGTLSTAAQTNITSLGTLSALTVSGDLTVDTSTLKVDSTNNRVGIGTSSPSSKLHLKAGNNAYSGGFRIEGTDETTALAITHVNGDNFFSGNATDDHLVLTGSGNVGIGTANPDGKFVVSNGGAEGFEVFPGSSSGQNSFQHYNRSGSAYLRNRNIASEFTFNLSGATDDAVTFKAGGNVGIGTSSPTLASGWNRVLHVQSAGTGSSIRLADSVSGTSGDVGLLIGQLSNISYFVNRDSGGMSFWTNNTEHMVIDASGNIDIPDGNLSFASGHGINFSATANATGTSNAMSSELLDDYEEGTWYPYLGTEAQLGGASSTNNNNKYVKIGRLVHCTGWFPAWNYANVTSGTYMMIRNLPFPPEHHSTGLRLNYTANLGGSTYGYGHTGLSAFYLLIGGSTAAAVHYTRAGAPTSGTAHAMLNIVYYTAS